MELRDSSVARQMDSESPDDLPLTEASFRALEAAYQRQWYLAQLVCGTNKSCSDAHAVAISSRASEDMKHMWADTARLHSRFLEIKEYRSTGFTREERTSLRLLGFRLPASPRSSSALSDPTVSLTPSCQCGTPKENASSEAAELAALRKECARLRQESATLLTQLAWRNLCESHASPAGDSDVNPVGSGTTGNSVPDAYGKLAAAQHKYKTLVAPKIAEYRLSTSCYRDQAKDVAIAQLFSECAFPSQVTVTRLGPDGLFMIDRPVWIGFASPRSATLIVRDPDGLEPDCALESYLTTLYAPLLQALDWRKPSTRAPPVREHSTTTS